MLRNLGRLALRASSAAIVHQTSLQLIQNPKPVSPSVLSIPPPAAGDEFNWKTKGFMTSIRHQYDSNWCTAHGCIGGVEGMHFKETGKLVDLSDQFIIDSADCTGARKSICQTDVSNLFAKNPWVPTRENYPGRAPGRAYVRGSIIEKVAPPFVGVREWKFVYPIDDVERMKRAVRFSPVMVCTNVDGHAFAHHQGRGVYAGPFVKNVFTHTMVLIGYGTNEDGSLYWIMKNSHGKNYGEDGYIRISQETFVDGSKLELLGFYAKPMTKEYMDLCEKSGETPTFMR